MAIRPVDLQMLVPKSAEISKTENNEARRPEVSHQQFAAAFQKQVDQKQQQVTQTNKAEQEAVNKDGSNKSNEERKKRRPNSNKPDIAETKRKYTSTSMFDISI